MITFHQPLWIAAGVVCCVIVWLLWHYYDRVRVEELSRFAARHLLPGLTSTVSLPRRRVKKWLVLLATLLSFTALARPQYGHHWIDVKHRGIDILFALDTSRSMLAEDVRPNRLERSKLAVLDFVAKLSGDRVGLLPFAGTSYLMCPLTADYHAFENSLMALDHRIIPNGGTSLESAIDGALQILGTTANHKILIIITDGGQPDSDVMDTVRRAATEELVIYTVGVGTENGELIPDPEKGGFIQDEDGSYVKSRLDRSGLQRIADETGGLYADLGERAQGLEEIYREKLALVDKTELAEKRKQVPIERYGWPLALAVLLLSIELIISDRRPGANGSLPALKSLFARFSKTAVIVLLLSALSSFCPPETYSSDAEDAYAQGRYIESAQLYGELLADDPDNPLLNYNSGTASYRNNLFEEAIEAFDRALASTDLELQEKSYFNRGNALYRIGEAAAQAQPDQAAAAWERAASSYEGALALNRDNERAAENLARVRDKLEELEAAQQNRQSGEDQSSEADESGDSSDSGDSGDSDETNGPPEQRSGDNDQENGGAKPDNTESEQPSPDSGKQDGADEGRSADGNGDSGAPEPHGEAAAASPDEPGGDRPASDAAGDPLADTPMSREEALQLLQALKAEEGRLDFFAPLTGDPTPPSQDW